MADASKGAAAAVGSLPGRSTTGDPGTGTNAVPAPTGGSASGNGGGGGGRGTPAPPKSSPTWRQWTSLGLGIVAFLGAIVAIGRAGIGVADDSIGLWLIGLICLFLGILLVIPVLAGADLERREPADGKPEKTGASPVNGERMLQTALRIAAVACLVVVIGIELDVVRSAVQGDGFAHELLTPAALAPAPAPAPAAAGAGAATQAPAAGINWPGAFVLSALIVAVTVMVSFTLYAIWRVARED